MGWSSGGDVMDGIIKAVRKHVDPEDVQTLRRLRPGQTVRLGIGGGSVAVGVLSPWNGWLLILLMCRR